MFRAPPPLSVPTPTFILSFFLLLSFSLTFYVSPLTFFLALLFSLFPSFCFSMKSSHISEPPGLKTIPHNVLNTTELKMVKMVKSYIVYILPNF